MEHCYIKKRKLCKSNIDGLYGTKYDSSLNYNRCGQIMRKLDVDRRNGILCDITLDVEGEKFPAHKGVLKAESPYFEAMFTSDFIERNEDTIKINGVTKDIFGQVLDYTYGNMFRFNFKTVEKIYSAAEMFLMEPLMKECQMKTSAQCKIFQRTFVLNAKSVEKFSKMYQIATHLNMTQVCKNLIATFRKKASEIASEDLLLKMSPLLLLDFIKHYRKFDIAGETNTVKFLIKWFAYKPRDRLHYLTDFMSTINFNLVFVKVCLEFETEVCNLMTQYSESLASEVMADVKSFLGSAKQNSVGFSDSVDTVAPFTVYLFQQNDSSTITISKITYVYNREISWESRDFEMQSSIKIRKMLKIRNLLILLNKKYCFTVNLDSWELTERKVSIDCQDIGGYNKVFLACTYEDRVFVARDAWTGVIRVTDDTSKDGKLETCVYIYELKGFFEPGDIEVVNFQEVLDIDCGLSKPSVNFDVKATMTATKNDIYVVTVPCNSGRGRMNHPFESTEVLRKYRIVDDNTVIMEAYDFSASYLYGNVRDSAMFSTINGDSEEPEKCLHVYGPFNPSRNLLDGVHFDIKTLNNKPFRRMKGFMHNPDGIKDVEGIMRAVCPTVNGDLILAQQKDYLVLFLFKDMRHLKPVTVLPKIEVKPKSNLIYLLENSR